MASIDENGGISISQCAEFIFDTYRQWEFIHPEWIHPETHPAKWLDYTYGSVCVLEIPTWCRLCNAVV